MIHKTAHTEAIKQDLSGVTSSSSSLASRPEVWGKCNVFNSVPPSPANCMGEIVLWKRSSLHHDRRGKISMHEGCQREKFQVIT